MLSFIIENQSNITLFDYIKKHTDISTRLFNKIKKSGEIKINTVVKDLRTLVQTNDKVEIFIPEELNEGILPQEMNLKILFEDDYFLILNKESNTVVHPTFMHNENTLANGVAYYYKSLGLNIPIRPITRLDRDTSGIIIFAKNPYIQESLINQMKEDKVKKVYLALVNGHLESKSGEINAPIARNADSIIEREVSSLGQIAISSYEVLKEFESYSSVKLYPKTGRTHQLRVHMQYIGHPILGDTLYGESSSLISRQALHAYEYSFFHPISKEKLTITCELPKDMKKLV